MLSTTVIVGLLYFSWERRIHLERFSGKPLRVVEFLYYRGDALLVFTLAVLLVLAVYRQTTAQHRRLVSG